MGKRVIWIILFPAVLISCSRDPELSGSLSPDPAKSAPSDGTGTLRTATKMRIATLPTASEMNSALLAGRLTHDKDCLYVVASGQRVLPVFTQAGTVWQQTDRMLVIGERRFRVGQRVRLTGGEPANAAVLGEVQRLVPSCDASKVFIAGKVEPED